MEGQDAREKVLSHLRSVTQSCKGGVPLNRLNRDYKELIGSSIPFRDLGYTSLESFIKDIPHVIRLSERSGQTMAEAVADESTAHLASLVARQKQSKRVGRPIRRSYHAKRGGFSSKYRGGSSTASRGGRATHYSSRSSRSSERTSPPMTHHSKQPVSAPKVSNSKPPAKAPAAPARMYEIAPRFKRLQARKESAKQYSSPSRVSPDRNSSARASPDHFSHQSNHSPYDIAFTRTVTNFSTLDKFDEDDEDYGNSFLQTPRPLLPKSNIGKETQLKQLEAARTAKEFVRIYSKINNLSVEYDTMIMGQRKKEYTSILRLGGKAYRSYPETANTEAGAEEIAAMFAKQDIENKREHLAILPETPIRTDEDVQILLNRIEEIVCEKPTGMFTHGICEEYENKFGELLPKGWIEKLKERPMLEVDQVAVQYGRVPNGISLIVRPAKSSGSVTPSEGSINLEVNTHSVSPTFSNGDVLSLKSEPPMPKIPELVFPEGNEWGVYITSTSNYIAARLVDLDEGFLEFSKDMCNFYDYHSLPVHEVIEKQLYAAVGDPIEGKSIVQRVMANKVHDDWVECYIVDEGIYVEVKKANLQELHNDFFLFPFQVIHLALDGLEDYEPFMKPENLDFLLDKIFIAVIKRYRIPEEEFFPEGPGILKTVFSVVLYDTSDNDADICLNTSIKQDILNSWECKLPKPGTTAQGYLSHIAENGDIFLRFLHPDTSVLEMELNKFSMVFEEACAAAFSKALPIPPGEICAAKFEDGKWYRARLAKESSNYFNPDKVEVSFIDYGNLSIVERSEVCLLQPSEGCGSEALVTLGKQAVRCELYNVKPSPNSKWTTLATAKLTELAPYNKELIVRVMEENPDSLPKVNLYVRIDTNFDSHIISVNEKLAEDSELFLDLSLTSKPSLISTKLNLSHTTSDQLSEQCISGGISDARNSFNSFQKIGITSPNHETIDWLKTPEGILSPEAQEEIEQPLSPPNVPKKGDYFDVFVTIAATPHNFIVQPLASAVAMDQLRTQMQQFYSSEENLFEKDHIILKENCFYAALHSDGEWYRVRVVTITNTDPIMAAVYYVDFGDFNTVSIQNLQVLWKQFRTLPCQAIKASLSGIKPIAKDWNPVHCVKFKEMVTERNFVSLVNDKSYRDEQDFCCLELELTLIDTSDPKIDVNINDLLVEMSMARRV